MERGLREAFRHKNVGFLEAMDAQPSGLKFLAVIRADLIALLGDENAPVLRVLDGYLKEKLVTWLIPTALALHQITWDEHATLLEKIVAYEVCLQLTIELFNAKSYGFVDENLIDLKRRLGFRPMLFWLLPSCDTRGTSDFHRSCSPQRHGHIYTAREDVEGVAEHRMHEHGRRAELGVVAAAGQLDGEHPGRTGVQYPVVLHQLLQQLCQKQRELNMAAIQGSLQ